mmetsp:Transcript_9958/g.13429  ORF Transcript_9958/g.13429 Transcript_9958/m.13429 type:complete len:236 (-) Transcript_9958:87-794(-)
MERLFSLTHKYFSLFCAIRNRKALDERTSIQFISFSIAKSFLSSVVKWLWEREASTWIFDLSIHTTLRPSDLESLFEVEGCIVWSAHWPNKLQWDKLGMIDRHTISIQNINRKSMVFGFIWHSTRIAITELRVEGCLILLSSQLSSKVKRNVDIRDCITVIVDVELIKVLVTQREIVWPSKRILEWIGIQNKSCVILSVILVGSKHVEINSIGARNFGSSRSFRMRRTQDVERER